MNWNHSIRQSHRWISAAFMVGFVVNAVAYSRMTPGHPPAFWINLIVLIPLFLLLFTGVYLFFQPYVARARARKRTIGAVGQAP